MSSKVWAGKAYNNDGNIATSGGIPFGAIRSAFLNLKNNVKVITRITFNGITYNIGRQAEEGMVVISPGYTSAAFFLPDDKQPMTTEYIAENSILSYLQMLGDTDYSTVLAWDYFAQFMNDTISNSTSDSSETTVAETEYAFTLKPHGSTDVSFAGTAVFGAVTTAKQFFALLAENLETAAGDSTLADWKLADNSIGIQMDINLGKNEDGTDNILQLPMILGRK